MIFIFSSILAESQTNLVPNGSFEQLTSCPNNEGQIYFAPPWFQPIILSSAGANVDNSSSSDLFNSCSNPSMVGVPSNGFGFQLPQHGNGFAGIGLWTIDGQREGIEVQLLQTLEANVEYCISFYVVSAGFASTDCINLSLSSDSILTSDFYEVPAIAPSFSSNSIISDSLNWVELSGTYIADGTENFILIGNSLDNSFCQVNDSFFGVAYYFIDNVSIFKCSDTLDLPDVEVVIPNVFSPNNDGSNDVFRILNADGQTHMEIYNRWGEKVYFADGNNSYWDGWTNVGVQCPDGVYFYVISNENKTYKGYVHLLR